jgi:hypothetical protein
MSSIPILPATPNKMSPASGAPSPGPRPASSHNVWYLAPNHQLATAPTAAATDHLLYVPSAGTEAGFWWGELLPDQRGVDAYSLVYDSPPLTTPVSMLGFAHARLQATADAPLADWMVRLEDVSPDGQVTAITGAGLAGAQRHSMEHPEPLEPGKEYTLDFDLHLTTWVWEPGHRIRVAISNAQWPMIWPTPYAMTTALRLGGQDGSALILPLVPLKGGAPPVFGAFEPNDPAPGISTPGDYAWPGTWEVERDVAHQSTRVSWHGTSAYEFPWGSVSHSEQIVYDTDDAHPAISKAQGESETVEKLADRTLIYRGTSHRDQRRQHLSLRLHARTAARRDGAPDQDLARGYTPGFTVIMRVPVAPGDRIDTTPLQSALRVEIQQGTSWEDKVQLSALSPS